MADSGVTENGFVTRSLSELRDEFRAAIQAQEGGTTLDLSSTGLLSQIIDVFANGLAELWAAGAGIYAGSYPAGATGVQVDQLLGLAGLRRFAAKPSVTNPTSAFDAGGNPLYGLVVYGTAGSTLPAASLLSNGASQPIEFRTDAAITIASAANAVQALQFTNTPTSGTYALTLQPPSGESLTTPAIAANALATATLLVLPTLSASDDSGWYLIVAGTSLRLAFDADTSAVQAAIRTVTGFSAVTVTGSRSSGMAIQWPALQPTLSSSGANGPTAIVPSVQNVLWSLASADGKHPFSDVTVQALGQGISLTFGAGKQVDGAEPTGSQPIALMKVASNSLFRGATATAASVSHLTYGHPAQGTGSATATAAGSNSVLAGQLTTLVQPSGGITGVSNLLDCIPGQDAESDADAIARMQQSSSQSTATLSAIVGAVLGVSGVTQAIAFDNATNASEQLLTFASPPTTGSFSLTIAGQTTPSMPYSSSAQDLQSAIQALPGLVDATVISAGQSSFLLRFGAQSGHLPHDLAGVATNSTGVLLTASFGCPAHAVEVVAQGGDSVDIAQAILNTLPAGIASYGRQAAATTAQITKASPAIVLKTSTGAAAGQIIDAAHLPNGTQIASLSGSNAVLSQAALETNAAESVVLGYGAQLDDGAGNAVVVRFSRPAPVTVYANLTIVTDKSVNSQFEITSVAGIQSTIISIINGLTIGQPVLVTGTRGLLNSFRDVKGVTSASLTIGRTASAQSTDALVLAPNETPIASAATINVQVA